MWAVKTIKQMESLADAQEELADIAMLDKRLAEIASDPAPFLPAEISPLILKGMRRREALRVWRGLSLGELGKLTGIDEPTLSEIEQGRLKCSHEMAAQLAKALNVPESWVAD